jgi:hypothetical protein
VRHENSISASGARRLLKVAPPTDAREQQVAAVLTALAPEDAADAAVPEAVLAAFADHARSRRSREAVTSRGRKRSGARMRGAGRAATIKAGLVVLALSSATVAAAAADILPAPAQQAAHSLFGSWGVPAPRASHGAETDSPSTPTRSAAATRTPGTGTTRASVTNPVATPPAESICSDSNTHGAGVHCEGSAAAGTAPASAPATVPTPATAGAGRATRTARHTASAHSNVQR